MNRFFKLAADRLPHVTYLGLNTIPEDWKHFKRTTHEYILYFIISGNMYLKEGQTQYHLKTGDMILLEPGIEHSGYKDSGCAYYYAHFSQFPLVEVISWTLSEQEHHIRNFLHLNYNESFLSEVLYEEVFLTVPKHFNIDTPSDFYKITDLMILAANTSNSKEIHYKTTCSCQVLDILRIISSRWMSSVYSPATMNISPGSYDKSTQLLDYLHSSYQDKITGKKIEELFAMNFDYLNRIFKKRTGTTIFNYLNTFRLEQAKQLLATTPLPLSEIASFTGFSDVYYFSHFFKKQVGIPPAHYRQQHK